MTGRQEPEPQFPVRLTQAQRNAIAEIAPQFSERLRLDERNQRTIAFTLDELKAIHQKCSTAIRQTKGMKRNSHRHVLDLTKQAIDHSRGLGAIPPSERVYQFKITLQDTRPPVWRRIQVKDCTLDKLHEHIQTAMGWTNSHLHHFRINDRLYGDPMLMGSNLEELNYEDSTATKLSEILSRSGRRSGSSTRTTSGIPGGTRFCSRAACGPSRVAGIRSAWRVNEPARPKTWAAPGETKISSKPLPTPIRSGTRSS
jgi:hypothetical protein